ncbi:MAG: DUF2807 domain-containing protein [Pseudomonadota bacterium]
MRAEFVKRGLPLAALSMGLASCFDVDVTINGEEGVPLSELEMAGAAPTELLLAGSDTIIITEGDELAIDVEGPNEAVEAVRFVLDGDLLGVTREEEFWNLDESATIRITMPSPEDITITGSGNIEAGALTAASDISILGSGSLIAQSAAASDIDVTMGGSGSAELGSVQAQKVEISVGGSGSVSMEGTTEELEVNLAGSGGARLADLKADDVQVSVLGSGSAKLQSDGTVEADIMGSGSVSVSGSATCTENAMGSGSLICKASKDPPIENDKSSETSAE